MENGCDTHHVAVIAIYIYIYIYGPTMGRPHQMWTESERHCIKQLDL